MQSRTKESIYATLDKFLRFYNGAGFYVTRMECDNEFKSTMNKIKDDLEDVDMNFTPETEHFPEAERNNCTIKY